MVMKLNNKIVNFRFKSVVNQLERFQELIKNIFTANVLIFWIIFAELDNKISLP